MHTMADLICKILFWHMAVVGVLLELICSSSSSSSSSSSFQLVLEVDVGGMLVAWLDIAKVEKCLISSFCL